MTGLTDTRRLTFLLDTVHREGRQLQGTTLRLFCDPIDVAWVAALEHDAQLAERLDAFVVRFGCMQDTIGDKLIPELRRQMLETPGAALDNLNRMERLGLLPSLLDWVEARNLRNRLIHEYLRDAEDFAGALTRARDLVPLLIETYNRIAGYCRRHLAPTDTDWPLLLPAIAPFGIAPPMSAERS